MFFELSRDATGFQYKTDFSIPLSTLSWNVMSCHTMFRGKGVIKNLYFNLKTNVKNSDGFCPLIPQWSFSNRYLRSSMRLN
jgi:hypothetical protein